jgi:hypothetical protein
MPGAAGLEQAQVVLLAPAGELAQVQLVRLTGQAAGPGQRQPVRAENVVHVMRPGGIR